MRNYSRTAKYYKLQYYQTYFTKKYNALLRGEQRNTKAAAYHLNH
ncbi:hypothetical protein VIVU109784_16500 [Vibrio vulnificus]